MPNMIGSNMTVPEVRVSANNCRKRRSSWILEDELNIQISRLNDQDLDDLRVRWRKLFRAPAPPHLPRYLILRIVRNRMQADAFGELNCEPLRLIN